MHGDIKTDNIFVHKIENDSQIRFRLGDYNVMKNVIENDHNNAT